jgi:hypothetical protein
MYKALSILLSIIILVSLTGFTKAANGEDGTHKYVGAKLCGMCHKSETVGKQYLIWEGSKHAQAYKTLTTPEADKIAKDLGHTTKAAETEACLKCHASGYNVDASLLTDKFNVFDGVQCETCHGPGSDYKSVSVMKDKNLAVKNGLKIYDNIEALCLKCHNEESPAYKGFDFKEMWPKIQHSVPKK